MIEIVLLNIFFWTIWACISYIPYLISQFAIDNYEKITK